ncbi:hypothetical protein THRCLA_22541 [Thraustotheca clavata]|uniref:Uncharacterized protein n=1 Tax=Thraustotheca clavata TaxID=74557 RepID=A0A1V9YXS9_9STRA|nr:hypothetical protein THRCLA_22541 [Thraustotheca clavata]
MCGNMRLTTIALSLAYANALWMNDLANKIAELIKKIEIPEIHKMVDDAVQEQLALNAQIIHPPLVPKQKNDGTLLRTECYKFLICTTQIGNIFHV